MPFALAFTIRGQLASINNAALTSDASNDETNDYFGMELMYNNTASGPSTTARYNGNIASVKWNSTGLPAERSYAFSYDKSGKLETANYAAKSGANWSAETGAQNEAMTYDHNGNIKTLLRSARKHQMTGVIASYTNENIDNLNYVYAAGNNTLTKVDDATANATGFANGSTATTEYSYDNAGNLTADKNKGIDSVKYNFMGKPVRIKFTDGKAIVYNYDASGNKIKQRLYQNTTLSATTDYVNGFVYENGALSFFGSPEGRVVKKGTALEYQYAIADHQGNTRVVFTSATNTPTANETSFETPSASFEREDVLLSTMNEMKRTGTTSQRLIGGYNSQVGATMSLKVYPGDKVKAEVYAKYRNSSSNPGNLTQFAAALTGAFGLSSGGSGEALNAYNGMNAFGALAAGAARPDDDDASPKGFITIMLFDKNRNFLDAAWDQLDGAYVQTGTEDNDPFDQLVREMTVEEEGYAYIFISNENATQVDIHFDDLKVTHTPTNLIQYNEYYPFGLSASTSWTRDNNKNDYLYNAANELNKNTGWYEMFYRGYDPALGRMLQVDPLAAKFASQTPFNYSVNNPIFFNDPAGAQAQAPPGVAESTWRRITSDRNDPHYMDHWYEDFFQYAAMQGFQHDGLGNARTSDPLIIAAVVAAFKTNAEPGSREWIETMTLEINGQNYLFDFVNNNYGFALQRTLVRGGYINGQDGGIVSLGESKILIDYTKQSELALMASFVDNVNDVVFAAAGVTYGVGGLVYNNVDLRKVSYKASKHIPYKAGHLYKSAKSTFAVTNKVAKFTGALSLGMSLGVAGYEIYTGDANTHTWVDLGVTALGVGAAVVFGTAAAPVILTAGVVYGVFTLAGGEEWIDKNFGYK